MKSIASASEKKKILEWHCSGRRHFWIAKELELDIKTIKEVLEEEAKWQKK